MKHGKKFFVGGLINVAAGLGELDTEYIKSVRQKRKWPKQMNFLKAL